VSAGCLLDERGDGAGLGQVDRVAPRDLGDGGGAGLGLALEPELCFRGNLTGVLVVIAGGQLSWEYAPGAGQV
jgi:hypothetical protein